MHPSLSRGAREALRTAFIELNPHTAEATIRELVACSIIVPASPRCDGSRRYVFTTLGARWKLNIHIEDDEAVPCRCRLPRSEHDARSPHAAFTGECRSFTPARPELHVARPREEQIQEVPRRCVNSPGRG